MAGSRLEQNPFTLVIHGGAGPLPREKITPEQEKAYNEGLRASLEAGYKILKDGGGAMDAAVAAVMEMEDFPLFNAGKGAVFNIEGKNELEASIMLSKPPSSHPHIPATRRGIGVTLLTHVRNPAHFARALYLNPSLAPHTLLSGPTAERIAKKLGEELVDPSYFYTERRWKDHCIELGLPDTLLPTPPLDPDVQDILSEASKGTVGAVALDVRGCIASVTSTGGRNNKLVGRIGDAPLMGSGFWAEEWESNGTRTAMGVSGTGSGDYFIRHSTASTVGNRMKLLGESITDAAQRAIDELPDVGGVVALDSNGNVALPFNCARMYRGFIKEDGIAKTGIFQDDVL